MPLLDTVEQHLVANEKILHVARLSWIVTMFPVVLAVIGLTIMIAAPKPVVNSDMAGMVESLWADPLALLYYPAAVLTGMAIWHLFKQILIKLTTTITVTTERVVHESGLIYRSSPEMHRTLIIGASPEQSLLGRLCDYADIHVQSVGGSAMILRAVKDPHALRNKILVIRKRTAAAGQREAKGRGSASKEG